MMMAGSCPSYMAIGTRHGLDHLAANVRFWPKADIPLPLHGMAWTLLGHLVLNEPNDCCDSCPGDAAANCLTQDWLMSAFAVTADINSPGISQKL
jgi:hypothetical protein